MEQTSTPTTATIHLHPQEELGQLIQRLIDEPATNITIEIPARSALGQGDIAFKVLADRAAQLGKTLTITTLSPQIATLASRAGLATDSITPLIDPASSPIDDEIATSSLQPPASPLQTLKAWLADHKVVVGLASLFIAVGLVGLWMALYFLPQATITIYTQQRTIDRDVELTANPTATSVNKQDMIVPATLVSVETNQEKSFSATGKKDVGDKATGTITITNKTTSNRTLPAGTVVASSGKSFVLTQTAVVPAATQEAVNGEDGSTLNTTFGKADVNIRAAAIGPEYNLAAKSDFAIGNFDSTSLTGKNDQDISGGTKKTVTIVTAQDRQEAQQSLTDQVEDQATQDLQAKISSDQLLLDDAIDIKVTSADFSKAANEEADSFTLNLTVSASSPVVKKSDLSSLLSDTIENKVPEGYSLTDQEPAIDTAVTEVEDNGIMHITSTFRAQIVPKIDTVELIRQIKGKHPSVVEEYLKGQPNFSGFDIKLTPKLPAPFDSLPSRDSAIQIKIEVRSN